MSSTYLSPSLNCYKHARFGSYSGIPILSCVSPVLASVCVREVGILFPLLSALLAGLTPQHTLHASVCFVSCNRPDPNVLVTGKSCSWTEILVNIT